MGDTDVLLNDRVVTLIIENDIRKTPTVWAEEATQAIMKGLIVTSSSADPMIREQAMDYRAKIEEHIFKSLEPIFRRAITAERKAKEK